MPLAAQSQSSSPSASAGWSFRPTLSTEVELDDNVFLLSDSRKAKADGSARVGSRYANMMSASDVITTVRADLAFRGPGVGGKRLTIAPEVGYALYARNGDRSSALYGLSLAQRTGRGETLRLSAALQPSRFYKNYLVDAIDADANGSILGNERLYGSAEQAETTVDGDYTFALDRIVPAAASLDPTLRLGGGWYARSYDAAFRARDLKGPTAAGAFEMRLSRGSGLALRYGFASLAATRTRSVMLLDEAAFGRDFNGNGNATDLDARAFEMVDHSRTEQELGASLEHDFGAADIELDYARRMRRYRSAEPFDVDNNGRRDTRTELGAALRYSLGRGVRIRGGVRRAAQTLNRAGAGAATGDVADYTKLRTSIALEYRF